MEILTKKISVKELKKHLRYFKTLVKAVVDIQKELIALDAELHSDLEELLLKNGSSQENLWGINLYPDKPLEEFIEYTALINIRPSQDNFSMNISNPAIRERIRRIVEKWINYET
ncbi:MAG TPA: hypothetical protein ENG68_03225 [bacterium]|nr:hypothetical protein [bacterium]